jgi:carbonic anhydrase
LRSRSYPLRASTFKDLFREIDFAPALARFPPPFYNVRLMKKLIRGIVDFRRNVRPSCKDVFARLALGQRPDALFIACSDSRVVPNLFASSDPGDLFVVRNVGNLVPSCSGPANGDGNAEAAAIEFALHALPIADIIVCGHSECGAMGALLRGRTPLASPFLENWLRHADGSLRRLDSGVPLGGDWPRHNQLSQHNVLEQLDHVQSYPLVRERLESGELRLHGWWFDVREAEVYDYDVDQGRFRLIDEDYAQLLLTRSDAAPSPAP